MLLVLPARLGHSGDVPLVGSLPQTDPAEAEFAVVGTRAPASTATVVATRFELGLAALLHLHRSLSHRLNSPRPSLRPRRLRPRRHPRPRLRAWRRPPGSPLSAARGPPAQLQLSGEPPLCAAPLRPLFLSLRARPDRGVPPGRRASPARAAARTPRGQF